MKDLIERQDAIEEIVRWIGYIDEDMILRIQTGLKKLPPEKPERKIGRWFVLDECANEGICCSECHKKVFKIDYSNIMKWKNFKFCPNCGADMRGEQNETD